MQKKEKKSKKGRLSHCKWKLYGIKSYEIKIYEDLIAINDHHHSVEAINRYTKLKEDVIKQMNVKCGYCMQLIGGKSVKLEAPADTISFISPCKNRRA